MLAPISVVMWFLPATLGSPEEGWRNQMVFLAPSHPPSYLICPATLAITDLQMRKLRFREGRPHAQSVATSKWLRAQPRDLNPLLGAAPWPCNLFLACTVKNIMSTPYCLPHSEPNTHQVHILVCPEWLSSVLACSLKPLQEGPGRNRDSEMAHDWSRVIRHVNQHCYDVNSPKISV